MQALPNGQPGRTAGLVTVLALATFLSVSCGDGRTATPAGDARPVLVVSVLPQTETVQRIAGPDFRVEALVQAGQDPHSWEATPRQMADLATAAAWFRIGVEFENAFAPKVAALYPKLQVTDLTRGMTFRTLEAHHHEGEEEHGADEAHEVTEEGHGEEAGGPDPHVWLGEAQNLHMARLVTDALSLQYPERKDMFETNLSALQEDIRTTWATLRTELAWLRGTTVYVFHPAFGYLLDDLGITQEAIETGGKEPSQKALAALMDHARQDGVKAIFVQSQFPASAAQTLADSLGAKVIPLDPLAEDLLDNLHRMGVALADGSRN